MSFAQWQYLFIFIIGYFLMALAVGCIIKGLGFKIEMAIGLGLLWPIGIIILIIVLFLESMP